MKLANLISNKNNFFGNILIIVGGTAFSQVIGIILIPVITRIYPPDQYGVLTSYTAILVMLSISASFDYQKAIPIAESEKKGYKFTCVIFVVAVSYYNFSFNNYYFVWRSIAHSS